MSSSTRVVPTTVTASFWTWIVSVAFSAIAVIIQITAGDFAVADVGGNEEVARAVAPIAAIGGLVVGGALRILFAVFLLRGRNWARIVLLIIAVLSALGVIGAIAGGSLLDIVAIALTVVAAVLMYLPASNAYFRRP